jgi:hypothetical protein
MKKEDIQIILIIRDSENTEILVGGLSSLI